MVVRVVMGRGDAGSSPMRYVELQVGQAAKVSKRAVDEGAISLSGYRLSYREPLVFMST